MAKENEEIKFLKEKITRLEKINNALMERVESSLASGSNAFALFEGNVLLRRKIDDKAKELEKAKRTLLKQKNAIDAVLMIADIDTDGIIKSVNKNFIDVTGYSKNELIGKEIKILNSGMQPRLFWKNFWDMILKGVHFKGEVCNKTKAGTLYWEEKVVIPSFTDDEITGFTTISLDISEKKMNEKRFHHQSKLAEIGELASGVGHEINNPLAVAIGNIDMSILELSKDVPDYDKVNDRLTKVKKAHERISKIVTTLRIYSRKETDKLETVSVSNVVSSTIDLVKDLYFAEGINIEYLSNNEELHCLCNEGKLQQIVMNLLSNAKDSLDGRSKKFIHISVEEDNKSIVLKIVDTGSGIPDSIKEQVLNPFFTTKKVGKGTGIGLSFVNEEVKKMNGELEISSKVDIGSTFKISLPKVSNDNFESSEIISSDEHLKMKGRALVVDDEEDIRLLLADLLEDIGLAVDQVDDGDIACEKVKENNYDFIFTDIKMKRMQGYEFLKKCKKDIQSNCKVFVVTAGITNQAKEENQHIFDNLVTAQVDKPFSRDSIKNTLKKFAS